MSVSCGLLLVRQLKDGFHHQGSPQDNDHDLDRNDNVVYKQNYGYASKQSNSIALDYDISKYTNKTENPSKDALDKTDKTAICDQTDQIDQTDQGDQTDQTNIPTG